MNKRTPSETLKSFSWIYVVVSIFYVVGIVICNFMPEFKDSIFEGLGKDGMLLLNITAGVVVALNLWYFWLCRRVADRKSEGTLYIYNPLYKKDRFCVQIKWYSLFDDIIFNMCDRLPKATDVSNKKNIYY